MPAVTAGNDKKRKAGTVAGPIKKRARAENGERDEAQAEILLLEGSILESKKNYNNIAILLDTIKRVQEDGELATVAAVALCRVFIRLLASGAFVKKQDISEKDMLVVRWLRERLSDYKQALTALFTSDEASISALTLAMRVLKAEAQYWTKETYEFPRSTLTDIVRALVQPSVDDSVRKEFVDKFVDEYDDVRFYTFSAIKTVLNEYSTDPANGTSKDVVFGLLMAIEGIPDSSDELEDFYVDAPKKKSHALFSLSQHKRQAQEAWLALMNLGLDKAQRKKVLDIMATSIAPWFTKPELLMDFLTDCYNAGGSMSLLALSGVFYLIQQRNLDYPSFYTKLYSLLDADILHSKHRSRFFRLLDTFLASSHLPAVLVASFIKRLSRLTLNAPPAAIVAIIPWIYNLMKTHPLCTFMMHRVPRTLKEKETIEMNGLEDSFLEDETDPMETRAIDSCLWEIVQLQSHYHPNVATIAKIISEQFTKQWYNLEDFLDHSYGSLLEAELNKEIKKAPVVEFMIPKRIFSSAPWGTEEKDSMLVDLWDFGLHEELAGP